MRALCVSLLLSSLLLGSLPPTGAEEGEAAGSSREERQKRSLPYWGLWSSDFYGWLEELRAQASDRGMQDLARIFWAHFPISRELGYDSSEPDPEPEE
ncbi:otospiralin-like [Parambassis ranga]|uniref:Otospiralin-like n=1 Tax=Parambassis ranga TaxID=210632 RepID=A0A6P7HEE0_9TELE|nr:otospiralin-like [Parambassis ranga]